ncbi:MAG TPA: hypothetical protein VEZ90_19195 [Blastocatellia bacterium]|nr:hypothetical protein [Blastocatellia bacterium]
MRYFVDSRIATLLGLCVVLTAASSCRTAFSGGSMSASSSGPGAAATGAGAQQSPTPKPLFTPPDLKPVEKADPSFKSCNPYYPLVPGSVAKYVIKNTGRVTANTEVVVNADAEQQKKRESTEISQQVETERGLMQTTTRKYVCNAGKVEVVSDIIDARVRTSAQRAGGARLESKFPSTAVVMDNPSSLKPGDSWSYSMVGTIIEEKHPPQAQPPIQLAFEVKGDEDITVPAGTFKTIHIATTVKGHHLDEYYARGIGLVKRLTDTGLSWELVEYSGLKPLP